MISITLYNIESDYVCLVPGERLAVPMTFDAGPDSSELYEQLGCYVRGWLLKIKDRGTDERVSDDLYPVRQYTPAQWWQFVERAGCCTIIRQARCYVVEPRFRTATSGGPKRAGRHTILDIRVKAAVFGKAVQEALQSSSSHSFRSGRDEDSGTFRNN